MPTVAPRRTVKVTPTDLPDTLPMTGVDPTSALAGVVFLVSVGGLLVTIGRNRDREEK